MKQNLYDKLSKYDQQHILRFFDELDDDGKQQLAAQIEEIDFAVLNDLIKEYVLQKPKIAIPDDLTPAPFFPLQPKDAATAELYKQATIEGERLLRAGKVAVLTVAGGQGTRLGFDGPKGTYPICPVSGKTLFEYFASSIQRVSEKYGAPIHWYIMTSKMNNASTVEFFRKNNYFGMNPALIHFFVQGTMPAVGYDGKLLLGSKNSLSLSPNGHGGTLLALRKSGALDEMKKNNVEYISYFQVDNPLVSVVNPLFVGLHALEKSDMSAIMLAKTGPFEKLGNFCISKGRLEIIEYSDLPDALAEKRNADGSLCFIAGSPAIHVISRKFIEDLTVSGKLSLPWHRADKKIEFINENGEKITPTAANGVKLESFIFDALPLAAKTMILEGDRAEEFAPTKNVTGVDSVESCRMMLMERDAKRLERNRVKVARKSDGTLDAEVEISPRLVFDDADAADYVKKHGLTEIKSGEKVYLQ